jgi:2-polyprenyl-3-methyl-5-hydroxy-6-metoxy-1,4-benzoquinol methylase
MNHPSVDVESCAISTWDLVPGLHYPPSEDRYIRACRARLDWTVQWLTHHGVAGKSVLEIGIGVAGICCRLMGASTTAWDVRTDFEGIAKALGIRLIHIDLSSLGSWPSASDYDIVIFAEVLEHLPVPPIDVLKAVRAVLKPNGLLLLTTPNLVRLSNRIRMFMGKPLFAPFCREELVMGHVREYTLTEVESHATAAGFRVLERHYQNWDLGRFEVLRPLVRWVPSLSNYISLVGKNDEF